MELLCPECRGPLAALGETSVRCTLHGGQYRVLFSRNALTPPSSLHGAGAGVSYSPPPPVLVGPMAGKMCRQHPNVQAIRTCQQCAGPMCATCDFAFGNVHLCPACAAAPQPMSSKRRKHLVWSYVLAVWATLGLALMMSGAFAGARSKSEIEALGYAIMLFVFVPSIVGTAMGFSAKDHRLGNPPAVWVAVIWNSVVLATLLLLSIIGTFSN